MPGDRRQVSPYVARPLRRHRPGKHRGFPFVKLGMDGLDGRVLPQRKQCWHEGAPLLATLGLLDNVGCVGVVVPHVCGGLGVEKPDEWQASVRFGHGLEALKHAVAGDSVVGANPIDRQDGAGRVLFCVGCEGMYDCFCACPCGESILVREACLVDLFGITLGEAT